MAALRPVQGNTLAMVVLGGTIQINGNVTASQGQLVHFEREGGDDVTLEAYADARLLWLSGEPIAEPVVGYGPFVMNSEEEIEQAVAEFNNGEFGRMLA